MQKYTGKPGAPNKSRRPGVIGGGPNNEPPVYRGGGLFFKPTQNSMGRLKHDGRPGVMETGHIKNRICAHSRSVMLPAYDN